MRFKLLILFLFIFQNIFSQQDAWVYLTDKSNVEESLANPITILTQKAIDRKALHNVAVDERDVPVNSNYILQIENAIGITVMAKSKWFNVVHVRGSKVDINDLINFEFVESIDFADKSLNISKKSLQKKIQHKNKLDVGFSDFNYGNATNQIEVFTGDELHQLNFTGEGMTIAVLDGGFPNVNTMNSFSRLRRNGDLLHGYDFVNRTDDVYANTASSHGTLVLSSMAGYIENEYVGTAPDASYYLFITEDAPNENPVEESYWVEAAERADSLGVNIINTSLGYTTFDNPKYNYSTSDMDGNTTFITRGANMAFEKGMLLVNAAGNSGDDSWGIVGAPADAAGVFSIGAVDAFGDYASFSSRGNSTQPTHKPDVVTQGVLSYLINPNDVIITANGTSFSSPIMAGGLACLWQAMPEKTNAEVMQLIRESASIYNSPTYLLGYGIPDLLVALAQYNEGEKNKDTSVFLYPNPTSGKFSVLGVTDALISIQVYDIMGRLVLTSNVIDADVSYLSTGVYFVEVNSKKSNKNFKLIKYK